MDENDEYLISTNSIMPCCAMPGKCPEPAQCSLPTQPRRAHTTLMHSAWQSMKAPGSPQWNVCQPVLAKLVNSSELFCNNLKLFNSQRTASWRGMC